MKKIKNILTKGAIAASAILPITQAEAQVSGNVEYIHSENTDRSFARANGFYGLPGNARGFSFVELYRNGDGYFGKSMITRDVVSGLRTKIEAIHSGEPLSRVGLGANFSVPGMPEGSFANFGILPLWFGDGKVVGNRAQAQYAFGLSLPHGFNVGGFGEWNLLGENGVEWGYGETELTKRLGLIKFGYNMRLRNNGDASPIAEHGLVAGVNF